MNIKIEIRFFLKVFMKEMQGTAVGNTECVSRNRNC